MSQASLPDDAPKQEKVFLVSYPSVIFLYPSLILAVIAAIFMAVAGDTINDKGVPSTGAEAIAWTFLIILSLNLIVISFDFPRGTSLTIFFVIVAIILGALLLVTWRPGIFRPLHDFIVGLDPYANATFYTTFAVVLAVIYLVVLIHVRFDYWEVRPNELLHHHGILSDLERLAAPNLQIEKEINDVFEYMLAGSGRLILKPANEQRVIILDHVMRIAAKEQAITRMLGALQVQVRTTSV